MTPPTYSPWWKAFEVLGRAGFWGFAQGGEDRTLAMAGTTDDAEGTHWALFDGPALYDAWSPAPKSPWSGYAKPTLFAAFDVGRDAPHPAPGFDTAAGRIARPGLDEATAVILDLPGQQGVALAAWIARTCGHQPVPLFNNWPHPRGVVPMTGVLGALAFYRPWIPDPSSPGPRAPVFLLDRDRLGRTPFPGDFDNRYYYLESDFPSAANLARGGVRRVLYVAPGTSAAAATPPAGIPPPGIQPLPAPPAHPDMDDLNPILVAYRKSLGVDLATADGAGWNLQGRREFAPAPRKTPFNTTKDPAFAGFRRASAGGFGRLVPEPGSGGYGAFG